MEKYFKWHDKKDVYVADLRSWNDILKSGVANYYRNGYLFASYQTFIYKNSDIEITKEEFETLIK